MCNNETMLRKSKRMKKRANRSEDSQGFFSKKIATVLVVRRTQLAANFYGEMKKKALTCSEGSAWSRHILS